MRFTWSTSRRGRSGFLAAATGPMRNSERGNSASRFVAQENSALAESGAAHAMAGQRRAGRCRDAAARHGPVARRSRIFAKQQPLVRDALIALVDKIGPSILLVHSQAGAFAGRLPMRARSGEGDPRDRAERAARRGLEFTARPTTSRKARIAHYGLTAVPLAYSPPLANGCGAVLREGGQGGRARTRDLLETSRAGRGSFPTCRRCRSSLLTAEAS